MIESHGVATVLIGLIRPHVAKMRPPRALWVPFQLGRPLGSPDARDFQLRVLRRALALLERRDGPVLLDDFADDEPGTVDDADWTPPLASPPTGDAVGAMLNAELERLLPLYRRAVAARGRTTVGLSGVGLPEGVGFVASCLSGTLAASPTPALTDAQALRFVADDLKAAWTEAASLAGQPSSRQLADWLWEHTVLGRVLIRLRSLALGSGETPFKAVAGNLLVPGARVALLEAGKAS